MNVTLLYFARLREHIGHSSEEIEVESDATIASLRAWLRAQYPALDGLSRHVRVAMNEDFVTDDAHLSEGCTVAFIPPVSGGLGAKARLTYDPIRRDEAVALISTSNAGAILTFGGTVRPTSKQGRVVETLDYEAYESMAIAKLEQCLAEAAKSYPILDAAVIHRLGHLTLGEVAVSIAVSAKHRKEAFEATQYIIDRLKEIVPIWKKETGPDGAEWVSEGA